MPMGSKTNCWRIIQTHKLTTSVFHFVGIITFTLFNVVQLVCIRGNVNTVLIEELLYLCPSFLFVFVFIIEIGFSAF